MEAVNLILLPPNLIAHVPWRRLEKLLFLNRPRAQYLLDDADGEVAAKDRIFGPTCICKYR
jgi:hypothetical protein